jgi:hypothetical protein
MPDHFQAVVDYVAGNDENELAKVKAERDYALHCLERELAIASMSMTWEPAEGAMIVDTDYYVVLDNGGEWRDPDLSVVKGYVVRGRLAPQIVRGRPIWIAKVIRPNAPVKGHGNG